MENKKLHNIEFLRFVFAVIIVYFHILHSSIMKYIGINFEYRILQKLSDNAGWIVECFFIISGYFLYKNIIENKDVSIAQFIWKKIIRLAPVLIFSVLLGVIFFKQSIYSAIFNSLFLQCIGLSLDYRGINWYISPLFWTLIFYYAVFKNFNNKKAFVFVGVICYFCYLANISYCNGGFSRATIWGIVNLGLARALAGIGLGVLIGKALDEFSNISLIVNKEIKLLMISIIEISSFIFLARYFLLGLKYKNAFIVVIVFSICFINKNGILSKLLNCEMFSQIGKYSYSIYVMQQISFWILQKTLWQTEIICSTWLCLFVSLIVSVFMGVLTYYYIEQPFYKLLSKKMIFNKC